MHASCLHLHKNRHYESIKKLTQWHERNLVFFSIYDWATCVFPLLFAVIARCCAEGAYFTFDFSHQKSTHATVVLHCTSSLFTDANLCNARNRIPRKYINWTTKRLMRVQQAQCSRHVVLFSFELYVTCKQPGSANQETEGRYHPRMRRGLKESSSSDLYCLNN